MHLLLPSLRLKLNSEILPPLVLNTGAPGLQRVESLVFKEAEAKAKMDPKDITPDALDTWGKLAPKSFRTWMFKLALTVAYLVAPWFLIQWRYALLYVLLVWVVENSIRDAIPVIVALSKQELVGTRGKLEGTSN